MAAEIPPQGTSYALPNSSMAIISLVAGILGLSFFPLFGSIVAIITGLLGKKEIRESAGTLGGEGMATAGLVLGWVGIGLSVLGICVFGVLIAIPFCALMSEGNFSVLPGLFVWLF